MGFLAEFPIWLYFERAMFFRILILYSNTLNSLTISLTVSLFLHINLMG